MKKIIVFLILMFGGVFTVDASEIYYINKYGVSFTDEQYNFFSKMYYEGYQEYVTLDDFNYFDVNNMNPNLVETKYANNGIMPMDDSVTGTKKTLKISKYNHGIESTITLIADWFQNPSTKSNDVIGARLVGVSLQTTPKTKMINSNGEKNFTNIDSFTNGFGQTFLLSGSSIKITQTYKVSNGGSVYASYQHAKKVISAANSRKYTISFSGYGGVFKFSGTATSIYDNSQGVSISV